jgi:hypothetical protein
MTVAKASEVHKVDLGKLKEALSGKKHKPEFGVSTIKATSTRMYKSASSKIASTMRKLIDQYEDGDMTEGEVLEVVKHYESLQKKQSISTADWRRRFEATNSQV